MRKLGLSFWVWANPLNTIPFSSIYLPEILDFFFFTIATCRNCNPFQVPWRELILVLAHAMPNQNMWTYVTPAKEMWEDR